MQYPQQQFAAQQTTSNVTVVQSQPQPVVYQPQRYAGSAGTCAMVFAIVLTFFAFFSGCLWALVCSVPAILFAVSVRKLWNAQSSTLLSMIQQNPDIVFAIMYVYTTCMHAHPIICMCLPCHITQICCRGGWPRVINHVTFLLKLPYRYRKKSCGYSSLLC